MSINEDNNIHYASELNYNFNLNERYIYVTNEEDKNFICDTPFLKILKPIHISLNKKKTIANKYIILETNDDLDFNNQIGEFMFIINKIHEISQEKIRENSMKWFNTEFDDIGLDIKVKRPVDQQKDNEFIKIIIPKDKNIEDEINKLNKGEYISCKISFKGLKVSSENIIEEWELKEYISQRVYDENQNNNYICDSIVKIDNLLENDIKEIIEENNNTKEILIDINNNICEEDNMNKEEDNKEEDNKEEDNKEEDNNLNDIIKTIYIKEENNLSNIKKEQTKIIKKISKKEKDITDLSIIDKIKENKINKLLSNKNIKKITKKIIFT